MANLLIIFSYIIGVLSILFYGASCVVFILNLIFILASGYGIDSELPVTGSDILASILCLVPSLIGLIACLMLIIGLKKRYGKLIEGYLIIQGIFFVLATLFGLFEVIFLVFFLIALAYDGKLYVFDAIMFIVLTLVISALIVGIAIAVFTIVWKAKKSIELENANVTSRYIVPMPIVHSGLQVPATMQIELNQGNNAV